MPVNEPINIRITQEPEGGGVVNVFVPSWAKAHTAAVFDAADVLVEELKRVGVLRSPEGGQNDGGTVSPMSDTPPPELVDRLVPQVLHVVYGAVNHSPTERILRERIERDMPHMLAALAEWADGGLIDPSTWTVVEARHVIEIDQDGPPVYSLRRARGGER